jgi:fructokinase
MPEPLLDPLPLVAVAGEALVDLVPAEGGGLFRAAPGGSPANVAVGLHRLGMPTRLVARLADDPMGRILRRHLETNGLDLDHVVAATEPTSLAIVTVEADGTVAYDFRVDGTADWQWTDEELADVVDGAVAALHVGSLAMALEPGASALRRLVERVRDRVTITFDPNVRPLLMGRREDVVTRVESLVALAGVVKASAEDLTWLYPDVVPAAVADRWLGLGPSLVAITLGPDGVVAVGSAAGPVQRPAVPVTVVDTVGAGDAFMAALVAGLGERQLLGRAQSGRLAALDGAELAAVLDGAALAAALTCSRPGADPPTGDELMRARQVADG